MCFSLIINPAEVKIFGNCVFSSVPRKSAHEKYPPGLSYTVDLIYKPLHIAVILIGMP